MTGSLGWLLLPNTGLFRVVGLQFGLQLPARQINLRSCFAVPYPVKGNNACAPHFPCPLKKKAAIARSDNFTLSVRSKRLKSGSIEGEAVTIPCSNKVQKRVTLPPHLFPIRDANFSLTMEGSFGRRAEAPFVFSEEAMGHLTLREALASNRLDAFVREQLDDGAELVTGSELERGLALLITQRRSVAEEGRFAHQAALRG